MAFTLISGWWVTTKYMAVAVAVAVAVSGGGAVAVAVAVAGLTKRFFNHIQKDFLIKCLTY